MRKFFPLLLTISCFMFLVGPSYAGTKALMEKLCTKCHGLDRPFSTKKSRAAWVDIVNLMAARNKEITEEYKSQIVEFLSKVRNVDTQILTAADPDNLTPIEKIHIPVINAPVSVPANSKVKIMVQISESEHPMTNEHYIYAVDLYVDNLWTDMIELNPGQAAKVEFEVTITKTSAIEVIVYSTVDGNWSTKTEIETNVQ